MAYYRATPEPRVPICGWNSRVNGEILTDDQTYNRDGALNYRYLRPQGTAPTTPWSKEWFFYGYNDRLVKMQTSATLEPAAPTCMVAPPISLSRAAKTEWQYSYSPSGEREIKRLVRSPKTDSTCGSVYPWTYYLLGTNDEQQVVYHGRQISRADCDAGGIGRRVFFYPVEYRSYGVDGVNIVWERDANGAMVARFVGSDIQGSERYAVGKNAYQKVRDYLPFGVDVAVANDQRRGYLGKESDYETAPKYGVVHAGLYHERLMDMSARKYSKTQGAFTSVDALWAGQVDYSPYAYAFHNPINFMDPSGYSGTPIDGGGGQTGGGTAGVPGQITTKEVVVWGDPDAWYWYNYVGIDGQIRDNYRTQQQIWLSESNQRTNESKQMPGQNYLPKSSLPSMAPPEQSIRPTSAPVLQRDSRPFDWTDVTKYANDGLGMVKELHPDVTALKSGQWLDAGGKVYKVGFRGNQYISSTMISQQQASALASAPERSCTAQLGGHPLPQPPALRT